MSEHNSILKRGGLALAFTLAATLCGTTSSASASTTSLKPPKVGDLAPEIELEELLQAPRKADATMKALRGKVVVIEFWATWCVPCVQAFPHLNELIEHFEHDDDFVFIAISDESQAKVEKLLEKKPLKAWIGLDTDRSILNQYGVNAIPRTIIIDQTGHIVADTYPMMLTTSALEKIRDGKSHNLPNTSSMMCEDGDGAMEMPGMPTSMAEINEMQIQGTAPGPEHEPLAALAGEWSVETSISPAGPMGPKLTSNTKTTRKWIQDGRVLQAIEAIDDESSQLKHTYLGYDRKNQEYYFCEISPLEPAPVLWKGQWDASRSRFKFSRSMMIRMRAPGQDPDDTNSSPGTEVKMSLTIELTSDSEYKTTLSIDFSGLGMGGPAGKQVMSESVAKRVE